MNERGSVGAQGVDAFLGKGTVITGTLVLEGTGRIEGRVEGEISAQDTLSIGEGAVVNANVTGTAIVIEGQVTGNVVARQRLELRPSSHVRGDITTPRLIVHEGATLDGRCSMRGADSVIVDEPDHILDRAREATTRVVSALGAARD